MPVIEMVGGPEDGKVIEVPNNPLFLKFPVLVGSGMVFGPYEDTDTVPVKVRDVPVRNGKAYWNEGRET